MQVLPIVERELRVAARQPKTWWRRLLTTAVALALFSLFYLVFIQMGIPGIAGLQTFKALTLFGMLCSLLAGPLATADCLSRERREGTLGLLFLTHLRSPDVVLGKMAAASLNLVFGLVALIPIVSLSLMLGGADVVQVSLVALGLFNIMFLSLATGLVASSVLTSGRLALGCTMLGLLGLAAGVPSLGEALGKNMNTSRDAWFYMVCPAYTMRWCLAGLPGRQLFQTGEYWLNMGGMLALAWAFLGLACLRTRTGWREAPASPWVARWSERILRWGKGSRRFQQTWRATMLERNPVAWLEGRDQFGEVALRWIILGLLLVFWAAHQRFPPFPDEEVAVLWPLWTHYLLCLLIAIQAPRRLADDKESGALELLLSTPLQPAEIVRGNMLVLRRRFGRGLLGLVGLDVFLVYLFLAHYGGWDKFFGNGGELCWLALCGLTVFPFQAWSFARVGMYQGLVQGNSLRATFMLVFKLGVLPWVVFALFVVGYRELSRWLTGAPNMSDPLGYSSWIVMHWIVCGICLVHGQLELRRHFRQLAAPRAPRPWWKLWSRLV